MVWQPCTTLQADNPASQTFVVNINYDAKDLIQPNYKYVYIQMTLILHAKGLSYILRVLYAPKLEGAKHPGPPLVSPTGRSKAATTQGLKF